MHMWYLCLLLVLLVHERSHCYSVLKGGMQNGIATTAPGLLPNPTTAGEEVHRTTADANVRVMDIRMPNVRPSSEDQYMCTSKLMENGLEYIVNFEALASSDRTHHLLVYGCDRPASADSWQCTNICDGSAPKILYAWARNAPKTEMPPDVGFAVGSEGTKSIVLQIHYKNPVRPDEPADTSGIRLTLNKRRQKYIAGIYLMFRYQLYIPPATKVTHGDISCKYTGSTDLYPFGFRVHAHSLSPVISGYQYNGTWSLLGKGNPQWPQAFYPITGRHVIKPGDKMFVRCTYDSTNRNTATGIGGGHTDEMCNFYMMYYTDAKLGESYLDCGENTYVNLFRHLPPGNDVPLPPNPALEHQAEGHHHSGGHMPGHKSSTKPILKSTTLIEGTSDWPAIAPEDKVTFGQVSGVGVDTLGNVHVFHRASRIWGQGSFDMMNRMDASKGPIKENTIITFNPQGKVISQWGAGMFFMPHGLHIDHEDNIWVTDVGLHQVFKFPKGNTMPSLTLGTRLVPGKDKHHFCKPTDVATLSNGDVFVTDGYCNSRVLKYDRNGTLLTQWGTMTKKVGANSLPPPGSFDIPHSVTAVEKRGWICVADRENGRIQCFTTEGEFVKHFHQQAFAGRLFAVTYSNVTDTLYAVNGPDLYNNLVSVSGFSIQPDTGSLLEIWGPKMGFHNPHDLAVSLQGDFIYVAELDPHRVWRMYIHKELLEAHKRNGIGFASRPGSIGTGASDAKSAAKSDLGPSLIIGSLLVVPVIFIVAVTLFVRLRKNVKHGYQKAKLLLDDEDFE